MDESEKKIKLPEVKLPKVKLPDVKLPPVNLPEPVRYYVRIVGTLFLITALAAILLGFVNMLTKPTIDRLAEEKRLASMTQVMPGDGMEYRTLETPAGEFSLGVVNDLNGAFRGGDLAGYCVQVTVNGMMDKISLMVGVDEDNHVTGVSVLSIAETAGLGARADEDWFKAQYVGKSGVIGVSKTAADSQNIQAITGATITSQAVTNGVNLALEAVTAYVEGGGAQ